MNLTPARGVYGRREETVRVTPMGKSSRLLMGHQREEEGEDVITQFLGEDEPREEEETSNIDMNSAAVAVEESVVTRHRQQKWL